MNRGWEDYVTVHKWLEQEWRSWGAMASQQAGGWVSLYERTEAPRIKWAAEASKRGRPRATSWPWSHSEARHHVSARVCWSGKVSGNSNNGLQKGCVRWCFETSLFWCKNIFGIYENEEASKSSEIYILGQGVGYTWITNFFNTKINLSFNSTFPQLFEISCIFKEGPRSLHLYHLSEFLFQAEEGRELISVKC